MLVLPQSLWFCGDSAACEGGDGGPSNNMILWIGSMCVYACVVCYANFGLCYVCRNQAAKRLQERVHLMAERRMVEAVKEVVSKAEVVEVARAAGTGRVGGG